MSDKNVWFKNPWVWLIIALPLSAVIGGIATVIITNKHQPDMVVDEYYKKGKAINQELTLYENAEKLNIAFDIRVTQHRVELKANQDFPALKLQFSHSTLAHKDFDLVLTKNAKGTFSSTFDHEIDGKWLLFVSPMDMSWKMKSMMALPNQDWTSF